MCFGGGGGGPPQQPQAVPPTPPKNMMTEAQNASYAPAALAARQAGTPTPALPSWTGQQLVDLGSGRRGGAKLPPGGEIIA